MSDDKLYQTSKELADALDRSEDYVGFMKRGGFRMPATKAEAVEFIRQHGPVSRFRLYMHRPPKKAADNPPARRRRSQDKPL